MADFLTRLVERNLGLAPVAQPLIAPMFAPGPAMAGDYSPGSAPDEELEDVLSTQPSAAPTSETLPNFSSPGPSLVPLVPQDASLATLRQPLHKTPDTFTAPRQHAESGSLGRDEAVPSQMTWLDNPVPSTSESRFVLDEDSPPSPGAQGSVSPFIKGGQGDFPQSDSEPSSPVRRDALALPADHKPKALVNEVNRKPLASVSEANTSTLRSSAPTVIHPQVTASEGSLPGKHPATDAQVQVAPRAVRTLADPVRNASLQPEPSSSVQRDAFAQPADTSTLRPSVPEGIHPQVTPHFEQMESIPANQRLARPESSSINPSIRVTIGRIEVRAVFSPPTPSPQRVSPPAPKLSLDEYLQSRHGGKR